MPSTSAQTSPMLPATLGASTETTAPPRATRRTADDGGVNISPRHQRCHAFETSWSHDEGSTTKVSAYPRTRSLIAQARDQRARVDAKLWTLRNRGARIAYRAIARDPDGLSGDALELVLRPDGSIGMVMLDATGHGPRACANAQATCRILGDAHGWGEGPPQTELERADALLQAEGSGISVTMGLIEVRSTTLRFANAGMPFPLLFHDDGSVEELEAAGIYVGGGYRDLPRQSAEASIRHGDVVVMASDGIFESLDSRGELFGKEGIIDAVCSVQSGAPDTIADTILQRAREHSGKTHLRDDATLIVFRWTGCIEVEQSAESFATSNALV